MTVQFSETEQHEPIIREGTVKDFNRLPTDDSLTNDFSRLKQEFINGEVRLKILADEDKIDGYVVYIPPKNATASEIRQLWVARNERGKGYGEKLLRNAIESLPAGKINMDIVGGEEMVKLAEKCGFISSPDDTHLRLFVLMKE